MIIPTMMHIEHLKISNRFNIDNIYNDSRLLLFTYSKSLKHIRLKNGLKMTVNRNFAKTEKCP